MSYQPVDVIEVRCWDEQVGAIALTAYRASEGVRPEQITALDRLACAEPEWYEPMTAAASLTVEWGADRLTGPKNAAVPAPVLGDLASQILGLALRDFPTTSPNSTEEQCEGIEGVSLRQCKSVDL